MKTQYQLTANDLFNAVRNAQIESVQTVRIDINGKIFTISNAYIVPQRHNSDFVLFATPISRGDL